MWLAASRCASCPCSGARTCLDVVAAVRVVVVHVSSRLEAAAAYGVGGWRRKGEGGGERSEGGRRGEREGGKRGERKKRRREGDAQKKKCMFRLQEKRQEKRSDTT